MKLPPDSISLNQNWRLSYPGQEEKVVSVPHSWNQDVPLPWEGPAVYSRFLDVPLAGGWLVFEAVSYQAKVTIEGREVACHRGLWDAFSLDLSPWAGKTVSLEVQVIKNGGETFPVSQVLSGFLPYVFATFGGIYGPVWLCSSDPLVAFPLAESPWISVEEGKIYSQGKPCTPRGVLTWGWHPELGHTYLTPEKSRSEIRKVKALGFNTIKFCLWMPPHFHLEAMAEEGLLAWLELPLWAPADASTFDFEASEAELTRIVEQYRGHPNILAWTLGCELSDHTPAEWRGALTEKIRHLTQHPLVKDNSGGAEMYGGDPREYGTFEDYHPYCDLPFWPPVLDSLNPGPRANKVVLLGETNDHDCLRDMNALAKDRPYWTSSDPYFNAQGVRWQHDFPGILDGWEDRDLATKLPDMIRASEGQSLHIRRQVVEEFHARENISGWVLTGWADTPISTAGFDFGEDEPRFSPDEVRPLVQDPAPFLIRDRRPPWVKGGNRPGWQSRQCRWQGQALFWFGLRATEAFEGDVVWQAVSDSGELWAEGSFSAKLANHSASQVLEVWIPEVCMGRGQIELTVDDGRYSWPVAVYPVSCLQVEKEAEGQIVFVEGGSPAPFWRESALDFSYDSIWEEKGWKEAWHLWQDVGGEGALAESDLAGLTDVKVHLGRIDTRTYKEEPLVVSGMCAERGHRVILTTLRPHGGLGAQPHGLKQNPAGCELISVLLEILDRQEQSSHPS